MSEWTAEWPARAADKSHWWFYGDLWGDMAYCKFSLVVAHKISNGTLMMADGQNIEQSQAVGVWMPCELPAVPNQVTVPCLNPDYCGTCGAESLCANCDALQVCG